MASWTFLNPLLLAFGAAILLPVLIHLIGRKQARVIPFAAFDFLLQVNKRLARREKLRQLLLLLLRMAAVAALVAAAARPTPVSLSGAIEGQEESVAIVIDTSASMLWEQDGQTLYAAARDMALDSLTHLSADVPVTLIFAGPTPLVQGQGATLEHRLLRKSIEKSPEPTGHADLTAAISLAIAQLQKFERHIRVLVFTDLSRNSFSDISSLAAEDFTLRLVDAAERKGDEALANLAIREIRVRRSGMSVSEREVELTIHNYGSHPANRVSVSLLIDDVVKQTGQLSVAAGASVQKHFTVAFEQPGVFELGALLGFGSDGFSFDDKIVTLVNIERAVRFLILNGSPKTNPVDDEVHFLANALGVVPDGEAPVKLSILRGDALSAGQWPGLAGFDAVLLANVRELPEAVLQELEAFVEAGGGVFVSLGDQTDFETVNLSYGSILAQPLRDTHLAADLDAGAEALGVQIANTAHPVFSGFDAQMAESLAASRVRTYFHLAVDDADGRRTLLRLDNSAPLLVERAMGKGRLLLFASSIDLDMNDLVLRPSFPPWIQRAMRYLAGVESRSGVGYLRVGESYTLIPPLGARQLILISPSGNREVQDTSSMTRITEFKALNESGRYRFSFIRQNEEVAPHLDVMLNAPLAESDFMPLPQDELRELLAGEDNKGAAIEFVASAIDENNLFSQQGLASLLILAMVFFVALEGLLAARG